MALKIIHFKRLSCIAVAAIAYVFTFSYQQVMAKAPPEPAVVGRAMVIDGDTLDIAGRRVRLEGIDAPEMAQVCQGEGGVSWRCGLEAKRLLSELTRDQDVACDAVGLDKYGRTLGICFVAGEDLNATLVAAGLARAFIKYSQTYVSQEAEARSAHRGLWQAQNLAPWDYRQGRWQTAESQAPSGCVIKGNITSKGMIYHTPWSSWYGKVKVDETRGERWFCSESEALAAGWRAALQN